MCDGKMEKGTASTVAAIVCGCDHVWLRSCVAAIALAAIALAAIVCGCDRDDKMETKMRGDGIFQFLLHI